MSVFKVLEDHIAVMTEEVEVGEERVSLADDIKQ